MGSGKKRLEQKKRRKRNHSYVGKKGSIRKTTHSGRRGGPSPNNHRKERGCIRWRERDAHRGKKEILKFLLPRQKKLTSISTWEKGLPKKAGEKREKKRKIHYSVQRKKGS